MNYTYHYQQPDEYHFSLDSIEFAEFVASELRHHADLSSLRVLDLCAGCGVIGIELSWYCRQIKQFDFIEVQEIYTSYFQQNVAIVNRPELSLKWHRINYDELLQPSWENKYNLIISNPPYFQAGHGMLSPSQFKNRCRFYIDSSFEKYIFAIANTLSLNGKAYFLLRSLKQHGQDLFLKMNKLLENTAIKANIITQIRGTDVVLIEKY